ncbi:HD domain-containing protein [Microbacterium gorillae]|uniref:HD domain-containing protein n=1 Tax=Microbacterium gorillae TaxID=1231063 RepID=UPI000694C5CF|nr:HD domain-containing protein [Microbacterium gorillae]
MTISPRLDRDVREHLPQPDALTDVVTLSPEDDAVWRHAVPYLQVRDNDSHTVHAYGIARALLADVPSADPAVVLPAILLHDIGWSTVPDAEVLEAIAPGGGRPDLVRRHEVEGARIATQILLELGFAHERIEAITAIIDGHDSRLHALNPSDAVVKDADKLWRVTPHGRWIVRGWFDLSAEESLHLTAVRVQDSLFTEPGRTMARVLTALGSIEVSPQLRALG